MGKNDDFAARLARIKEQTNAPDPTGGTTTDPRQARMVPPRSSSLDAVTVTRLQPKLVFGALAILALAAYALSSQSDENLANAKALQENRTQHSVFKSNPNSRVVYRGEETALSVSNDENSYVQKIRANKVRNMNKTDRRVAQLRNQDPSKMLNNFDLPDDLKRFANDDGSLSDLTKMLITQVESE